MHIQSRSTSCICCLEHIQMCKGVRNNHNGAVLCESWMSLLLHYVAVVVFLPGSCENFEMLSIACLTSLQVLPKLQSLLEVRDFHTCWKCSRANIVEIHGKRNVPALLHSHHLEDPVRTKRETRKAKRIRYNEWACNLRTLRKIRP